MALIVERKASLEAPSPVYDLEMRFLTAVLFLVPLCAQPPQDAPKKGGGPRPAPKNLKVLKVEGPEIGRIMRTYTTGLNVRCDFCHVQGDFASDEKPQKETARKMIVMTQEINAKFADAKEHVTCYTCHRGDPAPKTVPPAAAPPAAQ